MSSEPLPAIHVRGLGKRYLIYEKPHHRLLQGILRRPLCREFWALRGVDLEVRRGEALGIIGRNGSGKSTLLQVICGIVPPSEGTLQVNGRIAALLELGAGFDPEFTGRENIYVKSSLLGLSRVQTDERLQAIVDFAEIGEHMDQPVKTYSSGMFVRLAFAVAVHCEPDILVVDEALAVGDIYFQVKCHRRIAELRQQGCTLLFVTHSVESLAKLCDRSIVLDAGRMLFCGPTRQAVAHYLGRLFGRQAAAESGEPGPEPEVPLDNGEVKSLGTWLLRQRGDRLASRPGYSPGELRLGSGSAQVLDFVMAGCHDSAPLLDQHQRARILVRYGFNGALDRLVFGMQVRNAEHVLVYSTNSFYLHGESSSVGAAGECIGEFSFDAALLPGQYYLSFGVSRFDRQGVEIEALDRRLDAVVLTVLGPVGRAWGTADLDAEIDLAGLLTIRSAA